MKIILAGIIEGVLLALVLGLGLWTAHAKADDCDPNWAAVKAICVEPDLRSGMPGTSGISVDDYGQITGSTLSVFPICIPPYCGGTHGQDIIYMPQQQCNERAQALVEALAEHLPPEPMNVVLTPSLAIYQHCDEICAAVNGIREAQQRLDAVTRLVQLRKDLESYREECK